GKDLQHPGKVVEHRNAARNFLHATHIISPNSHTTTVLIERHDINDLYRGLIAETGYPRIDRMLNKDKKSKEAIKRSLGIEINKPVILYAPTWRGTFATVKTNVDKLINDLSMLTDDHYSLLFRGHHLQEKELAVSNFPISMVPPSLDTYDLLSIVDVLITDYSSVFFDFLPARKPIIFYAYDRQEYIDERGGLYFDFSELPGVLCESIYAVKSSVHDVLDFNPISTEVYDAAIERFCCHEDGNSTQRAVNFLLKDDTSHCVQLPSSDKQNILFFAGHFIPNGITSSFISLANAISNKYSISLMVQPESIQVYPERIEKLKLLSGDIKLLGYVGVFSETLEQLWINNRFKQRNELRSSEMHELRDLAFKREYLRLFGSAAWDICVNFEGYAPFWVSFFGNIEVAKKAVYLHSEMYHEMQTRFPYLRGVITQYHNYDRLISVSDGVRDANKLRLNNLFSIEESKFYKVDNNIDGDLIISMSRELCDTAVLDWIGDSKLIVNAARLSPEKDHEKLLNSFSYVHARDKNTKLIIIGDGPLRVKLEKLADSLGITDFVKFIGLI
ncbi:MAG: CDP-glycerol glycerophosphotransferase family protein, partial [Turicibacter sp.]